MRREFPTAPDHRPALWGLAAWLLALTLAGAWLAGRVAGHLGR